MTLELVQYTHLGSAAVVTINRPDKRNALSRALIAELTAAFQRATTDPAARTSLLRQATEGYRQSITGYQLIILKYFTDETIVQGVLGGATSKDQLGMLAPARVAELLAQVAAEIKKHPEMDSYSEDRAEYEGYINRALTRLKLIGQ